LPIELGAKSLILRVYDVLMNDRRSARCAAPKFYSMDYSAKVDEYNKQFMGERRRTAQS
jgi:hypothetical protein